MCTSSFSCDRNSQRIRKIILLKNQLAFQLLDVVNGPGEAAQTEIGLTGGGQDSNLLYLSGIHILK